MFAYLLFFIWSLSSLFLTLFLSKFLGESPNLLACSCPPQYDKNNKNHRVLWCEYDQMSFQWCSCPRYVYYLFKTYCMALCGSQLLDLGARRMEKKLISHKGRLLDMLHLPMRTHSNLLSHMS